MICPWCKKEFTLSTKEIVWDDRMYDRGSYVWCPHCHERIALS